MRWTIAGFVLELYGIVRLFADFFGVVVGFIAAVPVVGPYLEGPLRRVTGEFFRNWCLGRRADGGLVQGLRSSCRCRLWELGVYHRFHSDLDGGGWG